MRLLRRFGAPLVAGLLLALTALPASARLLIEIDKSSQRMIVSQDGVRIHVWPVSTGLRRYDTPSGSYTPFRMEKDHFSREWDDAPMPHSIFFTAKGHAIHGSDHVRNLGRPASHGCVRLHRQHAATLFSLVRQEGMANVRVVLSGAVPSASDPAVARRAPGYGEQPGYIGQSYPDQSYPGQGYANQGYPNQGYEMTSPRAYRYDRREAAPPRSGHWVQQPDGSRVFYDRERMPPPPPFYAPRPPGW
ncbi:MAG: L,D-transpeptidase [Xanthobacteraceae bacterium]|nr:L,D-transpeptidase [Xanthobacteraceae bacterium]